MRAFLTDFRYALRALRFGRSALLVAVVVLALAMAAAVTTCSVVTGVLLRSLPYADPNTLLSVSVLPLERREQDMRGATMSWQAVDLVQAAGVFEAAAVFAGAGRPVLTGLGEPVRVDAWRVTADFFARTTRRARGSDGSAANRVKVSLP